MTDTLLINAKTAVRATKAKAKFTGSSGIVFGVAVGLSVVVC